MVKSKGLILRLLPIIFATAWEFLLLVGLPRSYYIESGRVYIVDSIPSCWFRYSPSLEFVVLALLPAIVPLTLYGLFKDPALLKAGLVIGLSVLSVILASLINPHDSLPVLVIVSLFMGALLGKGKGERALLIIEGLLPDFLVLATILGGLAVSC